MQDIFAAARANDVGSIATLLDEKPDRVHARDSHQRTPLHAAVCSDPTLEDHSGFTSLWWALRNNQLELFAVLAGGAPQLGSPQYQFLRESYLRKMTINGSYHKQFRTFRVMKLGWTERNERCLAWQWTGPEPGWRCFEVPQLSDLEFEAPWQPLPDTAEAKRPPPCVAVVDKISGKSG